MKKFNEEVNRIKNMMVINEQKKDVYAHFGLSNKHVLMLNGNNLIISVQEKQLCLDLPYNDILITLSKEDAIKLRQYLTNIQLDDILK